ncbi:hypothetical protein [Robiginitalea sp. SC105]|uniref:hypothetical protein n=1 Tax=Robiginitalea sp. SC105 TaxID=2762332 RepID=UPI00163A3A55|nr:hypothetical protein [Robiginitalea sp. SC105]MBC2838121.1 hypothetical protein [Robiginitalea sp. SC105]
MKTQFRKPFLLALVALLAISPAFWLNPVLEGVLDRYVKQEIVLHSAKSRFSLDYEALELDIFSEELHLRQVRARVAGDKLRGTGEGLGSLRVGRITLEGISLSNFLWNKSLMIRSIRLDTLQLDLQPGTKDPAGPNDTGTAAGRTGIDSVRLPGIGQARLSLLELDHFRMNLMGSAPGDTVASFYGDRLRVNGIALSSDTMESGETLVPDLDRLELQLSRQTYTLTDASYEVYFDRFHYRHQDQQVRVDSLLFRPLLDADAYARNQVHSYETYDIRFSSLQIAEFDLDRLLGEGSLHMRSVHVERLKASIFRDKTKPHDLSRRVPLPDDALTRLNFPIRIDSVLLANASLEYREKLRQNGQEILVEFPELNGQILHLLSGAEGRASRDTLKIDLRGNLLGTLPVEVALQMPYATDDFHMRGATKGSSGLHELNPTIYPAIGMRFTRGRLEGMYFHASGSSRRMAGELTMLYDDLEVAFIKGDGNRKATLSWLANNLVRNSNPNRGGKTVIGAIAFERVPNKGLWNYVWKGIQSGVENSLNPLGDRRTQ